MFGKRVRLRRCPLGFRYFVPGQNLVEQSNEYQQRTATNGQPAQQGMKQEDRSQKHRRPGDVHHRQKNGRRAEFLDDFEQIGVGLNYNVNGEITNELPFDINMNGVGPDYVYHEGWKESLDNVTSIDELPKNASDYLDALENYLGVRI